MRVFQRGMAVLLVLLMFFAAMPVQSEEGYWQGLTTRFVVFKSEDAARSGPACAKAVLYHLISEKASQKRLAEEAQTTEEGTNLFKLVKVLNGNQVYKRFSFYSAPEYNTFSGLLYETISLGKTPVIVGVLGKEAEGWPGDSERKYVLVYQITADMSRCKIADPQFLAAEGEQGEPFFTVTTGELFQAYKNAGDGMTYTVPGAGELSDSVPQGELNIIVPETLSPADVKKLNFELVNTTEDPVFYNERFTLERKSDESDEWEKVEIPDEDTAGVNYKLAGGKKKVFSTDVLDRIEAEAGTYRLSKIVIRNKEKELVPSNEFILEEK